MQVYLNNIVSNIKEVKKNFDYQYYFGVVKADCYGHSILNVVEKVIAKECNYIAAELLEEAIYIRNSLKDIPILCIGYVGSKYLTDCIENNITITVNSLEYAKEVLKNDTKGLKCHLKVNSGMNRLGISSKEELKETYELLKDKVEIEGLFTHIFDPDNENETDNQFSKFKEIIESIDYKTIPIIHASASDALTMYDRLDYINGCRLGIVMYGFSKNKKLHLKSTFSLHSQVIQINELQPGDKVGYSGSYISKRKEGIAVVAIGYADGIIRKNTGRKVYINDRAYPIVGNICMDMLFVKIDEHVNLYDDVVIIKDKEQVLEIAEHLETIPYEVMTSIGGRVPREYTLD